MTVSCHVAALSSITLCSFGGGTAARVRERRILNKVNIKFLTRQIDDAESGGKIIRDDVNIPTYSFAHANNEKEQLNMSKERGILGKVKQLERRETQGRGEGGVESP